MSGSISNILNIIFLIIFLEASYIDCRNAERHGRRFLKPALMPLLIVVYCTGMIEAGGSVSVFMILALACGFAGDTLLLKEKYFTFGLAAFLLEHIFLIIEFTRGITFSEIPVIILAAIVLYALAGWLILRRLLPAIDRNMKAPVFLYMTAILMMSYTSLLRFSQTDMNSFLCAFIGSLLFITSDSILAYNVFLKKSDRLVMETYLAAQFLIATGMILAV